jgi:acetyltransferase
MSQTAQVDRSRFYAAGERFPLDVFFHPQRIAVIGASDRSNSVGRTVFANLLAESFSGEVLPVNPGHRTLMGRECYPTIQDVPGNIDLAVVATPAAIVPQVMREIGAAAIPGALVISAGFRERGPQGAALEQEMLDAANRFGIRVIGPNSLGISCPLNGLNATFAGTTALPGKIGFLSQSGALCTAVLDWSLRERIGFSVFASLGAMADVDWGDMILHLGADYNTRSILIYMESIGDPRSFLSAAREVALTRPIIVLKGGRSPLAAPATAAHLGNHPGDDAVLDAAFRRCGVLRVNTIADLFSMAEMLGRVPRPAGPRLTILTNAGGPGVLATDALVSNGGALAEIPPDTLAALDEVLPEHWSHGNPIDLLGDAGPERYEHAINLIVKNPHSDGLLVVLTPQAMTDPLRTAEILRTAGKKTRKPILASWMGGASVAAGEAILHEIPIPTFAYPDAAALAFCRLWQHSCNLRALYETPALIGEDDDDAPDRARAGAIIRQARQAGRYRLDPAEAQAILEAYDISTVELPGARRYPLQLRLWPDPQLGRVIQLALGGVWTNVIEDRTTGLPPLNTTLARRMLERLSIYSALSGRDHSPPVDIAALEALLVRFSHLAVEQPWIKEVIINPLQLWREEISARAVQINLYGPEVAADDLPPLAIRPYPQQYVQNWVSRSGLPVLFRPIRPEDEPLMVDFHHTLSEQSVYYRYFYPLKLSARIDHERLARVCFTDYSRSIVLVAECQDPEREEHRILAVGRINRIRNTDDAEFAVLVSDEFHGRGLGNELLRQLIGIARAEQIARIKATILPENSAMQAIAGRMGFKLRHGPEGMIEAIMEL